MSIRQRQRQRQLWWLTIFNSFLTHFFHHHSDLHSATQSTHTFHLNAHSYICIFRSLSYPFRHPLYPLSSSWMDIMKNAGISIVEQITNSLQMTRYTIYMYLYIQQQYRRWSKTFKWFWWTVCICWKGTKCYCSTLCIFVGGWNNWLAQRLNEWMQTSKQAMRYRVNETKDVCVCMYVFVCVCSSEFLWLWNIANTLITFAKQQLFETIIALTLEREREKWRTRLRVRYFNICIL